VEGGGFHAVLGQPVAAVQQLGGDFRADHVLVSREVIRMGVGNKGAGFPARRIQPQVGFRQIQATLVTDFDQGREVLRVWRAAPRETMTQKNGTAPAIPFLKEGEGKCLSERNVVLFLIVFRGCGGRALRRSRLLLLRGAGRGLAATL